MSFRDILIEVAQRISDARKESFAEHPVANLIRQELPRSLQELVAIDKQRFMVRASAGQGNWAKIPWLAIFRTDITKSAQTGIYPVYLFKSDGSGLYLSLGFGVTELKKAGMSLAKKHAAALQEKLRDENVALKSWPTEIDLSGGERASQRVDYEWGTAGAKYYSIDSMPSDAELAADLEELMAIYSNIDADLINAEEDMVSDTSPSPISEPWVGKQVFLPKPFLLLAGISGTGKTRLIRQQAKVWNSYLDTYCLVPVRPDWHEPSDLLGYVSRLGSNGAEYVVSDVTKFIAKAWRAVIDAGVAIGADGNNQIKVLGNFENLSKIKPYWLCLDEMNLAPVEQYFADYLSVSETRDWEWSGDKFTYRCDALLNQAMLEELSSSNKELLRRRLGLQDPSYSEFWELLINHGLSIPFNLIVAGTVNMDETTHGFSRKVVDRAFSFDFGEFFPNNFDQFFESETQVKPLTYPVWSQATQEALFGVEADSEGVKNIQFLKGINEILRNTPYELAYRALNELLLSVVAFKPKNEEQLQSVWDDFLMCKVLPRIEGDLDRLNGEEGVLYELEHLLAESLHAIWGEQAVRVDLYRENTDGSELHVRCRTQQKLKWMRNRLRLVGFTSFWP